MFPTSLRMKWIPGTAIEVADIAQLSNYVIFDFFSERYDVRESATLNYLVQELYICPDEYFAQD